MEDGSDLVLSQEPLKDRLILQIPPNGLYASREIGPDEFAVRNPIANQTDDIGLLFQQFADDPSTGKTGSSGHEGQAILPECRWRHQAVVQPVVARLFDRAHESCPAESRQSTVASISKAST